MKKIVVVKRWKVVGSTPTIMAEGFSILQTQVRLLATVLKGGRVHIWQEFMVIRMGDGLPRAMVCPTFRSKGDRGRDPL